LFPATQAVDFVPSGFGRWWLLVLLALELWSFLLLFLLFSFLGFWQKLHLLLVEGSGRLGSFLAEVI